MTWRLEKARRGGARCHECTALIARGEHRFGRDGYHTRWFHLRCAERGVPKAFAPFAVKAAPLLAAQGQADAQVREKRPKAPRLVKTPGVDNTPEALAVLSDELESAGDLDWATFIRLRLAAQHAEAIDWFDARAESLTGDLNPLWLDWRDGVIVRATLEGKGRALELRLRELFALRTASRLEELRLRGEITPAVIRLLTDELPPSVRWLTLAGPSVDCRGLELRYLKTLRLEVKPELALGVLDARLPALEQASFMTGKAMSADQLDRLLDSTLLPQLSQLELDDESPSRKTLDDAGLARLTERHDALAHLTGLWIDLAGRKLAPSAAKAVKRFFAKPIKAASKVMAKRTDFALEQTFDPFVLD